MWPSLPTANNIADVANWFFISSLVVGVVSTILIVWMAGVKEAYWEKDRTESSERVASLSTQGEQLRKDTAEANARAIEARLELEKFKAPRLLTQEQIVAIVKKLPQFPMNSVSVSPGPVTVETVAFAEQIVQILSLAGIGGTINPGWGPEAFGVFTGVVIQHVTGNDAGTKLAEALAGALNDEQIATQVIGGMHESVFTDPRFDRNGTGSRNVLIAIGEKPR